jgi:hypothetical protein
MIKTTSIVALTSLIAFSLVGILSVSAQTEAVMPTLYTQSGVAVNTVPNTPLAAGWYFLQSNGSVASQVYYYGNGTYYSAANQSYGGSVGDPNGTAGVTLNYTVSNTTPGLPDTGAGGESAGAWVALILSGLVGLAGIAYLMTATTRSLVREQH